MPALDRNDSSRIRYIAITARSGESLVPSVTNCKSERKLSDWCLWHLCELPRWRSDFLSHFAAKGTRTFGSRPKRYLRNNESQLSDSNRRPADYKSAALPTELSWPVGPGTGGEGNGNRNGGGPQGEVLAGTAAGGSGAVTAGEAGDDAGSTAVADVGVEPLHEHGKAVAEADEE
jgi:hypothetical protein